MGLGASTTTRKQRAPQGCTRRQRERGQRSKTKEVNVSRDEAKVQLATERKEEKQKTTYGNSSLLVLLALDSHDFRLLGSVVAVSVVPVLDIGHDALQLLVHLDGGLEQDAQVRAELIDGDAAALVQVEFLELCVEEGNVHEREIEVREEGKEENVKTTQNWHPTACGLARALVASVETFE